MIWKFAIRNIFRNKKRSLLTALSVFMASIVVGILYGWVNGVMDMYMDNYVTYQTGHIRITTAEYKKKERFLPVSELLYDHEQLKAGLLALPGVTGLEERIRFGLLLGKGDNTVDAIGMGLDLEHNRFELAKKLQSGTISPGLVYLGKNLALRLGVKEGEEILLASKTSEGGLNGIKLRVGGIVSAGVAVLDRKFFFISLENARRLLKINQATTEIYVFTRDRDLPQNIIGQVRQLLPPGALAETYQEQMGDFFSTLELAKIIYLVFEIIILALASIVIVNTMTMAIFERIREIGTLKALGFSDRDLFRIFTAEGALLGMAGGIAGALVALFFNLALGHYGVNFESLLKGMEAPLEYIIRPRVSAGNLLAVISMAVVVPILAAMIPARYLQRFSPADALRK